MATNCELPTDFRNKHGFSENYFKSIRDAADVIKLAKKEVRNLVKNVGIDDPRALELKSGKEHIFGKNLANIEEFNPSKGKVPKDTLVKRESNDGKVEHFISERPTNSVPSKWNVSDKTIRINPDWTFVGKNATTDASGALKRYKEVGRGVYKEAKDGDTILKVSKLWKGEDRPPLHKLAEDGYDGIRMKNGDIKVFSRQHQAVDPSKVFIRDKYIGVEQSTKNTEPVAEEISKKMETLGLGKRTALVVGGGLAGDMLDGDGNEGMWVGGALGFALGMPSVQTYLKEVVKGKSVDADKLALSIEDAEKELTQSKKALEKGFSGDTKDPEAVAEFNDKVTNPIDKAREKGKGAWEAIKDNDYLKSGFGRLKSLGSKSADKGLKIFQRAETSANPYFGIHTEVINRFFGHNTSLDDINNLQERVIRDYLEKQGIAKTFENHPNKWFVERMGETINRIITHEGKLDETGKLISKSENNVAQRIYKNESFKNRDEWILKDPRGQRIVEAQREIYQRMGDRTIEKLDIGIDNIVGGKNKGFEIKDVPPAHRRIFNNYRESGLSIKQWDKRASKVEAEAMEAAKENHGIQEAIEYREKQVKINDLRGRYVPQVQSAEKINAEKIKFLKRTDAKGGGKLIDAGVEEQDLAWYNHFTRDIIAYNKDGYVLNGLNAAEDNIETLYFKDFPQAKKELRNQHILKIADPEVRAKVVKDLDSDSPEVWNKYIGEKKINDKSVFYVKNPDDLGYDIAKDMSKGAVGKSQRTFLNMSVIKQSNYLDNPRNYIIPSKYLETDMNTVLHRYSRDVGLRTHLIENGLGTKRGLDNMVKNIQNELEKKGVKNVGKETDRVRDWYAQISNTRNAIELDKSPEEILASKRQHDHNYKVMDTLMRTAVSPFIWATRFYASLTPAVLGSYLSSPKQIAKTYWKVLKDPSSLKAMEDNAYKFGVIERKLSSFSPYGQFGQQGEDLLDGRGGVLDWTHNASKKMLDLSMRTSLTKGIASKLAQYTGRDFRDLGLLRLFSGNIYDINGAETSMVLMAQMSEVEDLVKAGKQMIDTGVADIKVGRKTVKLSSVRRRLEEMGVDDPELFIKKAGKETEDTIVANKVNQLLTGKEDYEMEPYLRDEYSRIMDNTVNQYHGRTKLTRPLKWVDNPWGRVLSQFSVYSQNFGVQTVRKRMYQPLKDWSDRFELKQKDKSLFNIYWNVARKNEGELKKIFGENNWEKAYNEFPMEAVETIFKVTPVVFGAGVVLNAERNVMMDALDLMSHEAVGDDDYEKWKRSRRSYSTVNSWFGDGKTGFEIGKIASSLSSQTIGMSYLGKIPQVLQNFKYGGGIAGVAPVLDFVNDGVNAFGQTIDHPWSEIPKAAAKNVIKTAVNKAPIFGTFHYGSEAVNHYFNRTDTDKSVLDLSKIKL